VLSDPPAFHFAPGDAKAMPSSVEYYENDRLTRADFGQLDP